MLIGALLGACVPATPALPSQGGPAWFELSSPHFTMWTDADTDDAAHLLHAMEDIRQLMHAISKFPESDAKCFVIAFRNAKELSAFAPRKVAAMAWSANNPLGQPGIALSAESFEGERAVATHEIAHVVSYSAVPVQPSWFAEGLASYFETLKVHADRTSAELGTPRPEIIAPLLDGQRFDASALFGCTADTCPAYRFYPTAWLAYIHLVETQPERLGKYMERLAALPAAMQSDAWTEVFPSCLRMRSVARGRHG